MPENNSDNSLARLRGVASPELLELLSQILRLFPPEFQYRVRKALDTLPEKGDNMQRILEVVRAQWRGVQSKEWIQIAIVGPSQTGKATLLNTIEAGQSATSPRIFTLVETPGLTEYLGYEKANRIPEELDRADLILLLLDCQYEVSEATHRTLERLKGQGTQVLVVLNKCDFDWEPFGDCQKSSEDSWTKNRSDLRVANSIDTSALPRHCLQQRSCTLPTRYRIPRFSRHDLPWNRDPGIHRMRPGRSHSHPCQRSSSDDRDTNQHAVENCPGLRPTT